MGELRRDINEVANTTIEAIEARIKQYREGCICGIELVKCVSKLGTAAMDVAQCSFCLTYHDKEACEEANCPSWR